MTLPARTTAVVVGVERYDIGQSWQLDGPALDACRFAAWLHSRGVPPDRITVLVSPLPTNAATVTAQLAGYRTRPATSDAVRQVFARELPQQQSDLLIVFWGGHGVIEREERRLLCADAARTDKRNLNLTALLRTMRSSTYAGHPQQQCFVDACQNLVSELGWEGRPPNEEFAEGNPDPRRDQRTLLAASPGERARNLDALKTGLFSQALREALEQLAEQTWPPDADQVREAVNERFEELRLEGRTAQIPSSIWFRSRVGEDTQVFASGAEVERATSAALGSRVLTFPEFRDLKAILYGAPAPARLTTLYRDATRNVVDPPVLRTLDLMSAVTALRGVLSPMPLFSFLVRLAAGADEPTRDRLTAWIDRLAPRWLRSVEELEELEALREELHRRYVLLRLQPDLLGDGLVVTGWIYDGPDGRQAVTTDEPWPDERIAAEVGHLLDGFDPERDALAPVVEFLVPTSLLDDEFESLPIRLAGADTTLGTTCPVVMRALDRPPDADVRARWQAAWTDLGDGYRDDAICWVEGASEACRVAAVRPWACTALAYERRCGPQDDAGLQATLSGGTPVALWHRGRSAHTTRRTALEQVLRISGLHELPDVVLAQRISAHYPAAAADHSGRDLVLLWDDPTRVPAEQQWRPPLAEGSMP